MTNLAAAEKPKRGFWWWVTAILAPIGIFGGPIAIADMLAGVIEWKGWINYIVAYWAENIGGPFRAVLSYLASLARLRAPPEWATDYITFGILFWASVSRSFSIFSPADGPPFELDLPSGLVARVIVVIWSAITVPIMITVFVFPFLTLAIIVWPVFLFFVVGLPIWSPSHRGRESLHVIFLTLAPFAIFLVLFGINALMG